MDSRGCSFGNSGVLLYDRQLSLSPEHITLAVRCNKWLKDMVIANYPIQSNYVNITLPKLHGKCCFSCHCYKYMVIVILTIWGKCHNIPCQCNFQHVAIHSPISPRLLAICNSYWVSTAPKVQLSELNIWRQFLEKVMPVWAINYALGRHEWQRNHR